MLHSSTPWETKEEESDSDALEVHSLGKDLDLLGKIANAQCGVVAGTLDAPVVEEFGDGLAHTDTAVGIADVQNVAGNDLGNGIDQLEGLLRAHLSQIQNGAGAQLHIEVDAQTLTDLAVMDVSFISQRLLYPAVADILSAGGLFVSLIKPQFEVGKQHIGKGGIVRDPSGKLFRNLLAELTAAGSNYGLRLLSYTDSPILGGDGNAEELICFVRCENV